ncbi:MAG TPA: PadR family transcriptional regulator [Acidimicrobiales bacterium]
MSLKHALLALLTSEPMTGYDLVKSYRASAGLVWHAPDSQIYPVLRKMESEGLISGTPVPRGEHTTKQQYSITEAGVRSFREWMNTTLEYSRERDPAHLKAAYFEWATPEAARRQLLAHIDHYRSRVEVWRSMATALADHSDPTVAKRLKAFPEPSWEAIIEYKIFAYEGLVAQAEQQIIWARRGLELIDRLSGHAVRAAEDESTSRAPSELRGTVHQSR